MLYLIITILATAGMVLMFKFFEVKRMDNMQALLANYLTAATCCNIASSDGPILFRPFWLNDWFWFSLILGIIFIAVFYATALTAQKVAVSISIVAGKMSLVITLLFLYFYYHEPMNFLKWAAVGLAIFAVYLTTRRRESTGKPDLWLLILPLLVFAGSGIVDSALKFLEKSYFKSIDIHDPLGMVFFFAGITGLILFITKPTGKFSLKSFGGGVMLGLLNYISTYTLLHTLSAHILPDTVIFPLINIGVVIVASLFALVLFKEQLSKTNYIGIGLALGSIALLAFS